jgi:hypothetical protein
MVRFQGLAAFLNQMLRVLIRPTPHVDDGAICSVYNRSELLKPLKSLEILTLSSSIAFEVKSPHEPTSTRAGCVSINSITTYETAGSTFDIFCDTTWPLTEILFLN